MARKATVKRKTKETDIAVNLDIDNSGQAAIETGMPFFNHMLDAFSRHGIFYLDIQANGEPLVDFPHSVFYVLLALEQAMQDALGNKHVLHHYRSSTCPRM